MMGGHQPVIGAGAPSLVCLPLQTERSEDRIVLTVASQGLDPRPGWFVDWMKVLQEMVGLIEVSSLSLRTLNSSGLSSGIHIVFQSEFFFPPLFP